MSRRPRFSDARGSLEGGPPPSFRGHRDALFTELPSREALSKIKQLVHKAESRSRKALVEAIGAALWAVTASDARGFFKHCEYRQAVQFVWTP
jgi:hypothetical protein